MERLDFVKNGLLRWPPEFRLHPTRNFSCITCAARHSPACCPLASSLRSRGFRSREVLFQQREANYPNGNRATISGYWKSTGIDRQIMTSKGCQVVGMKKTLVFYKGKRPSGTKTDWIKREYRLTSSKGPISSA